MIVQAWCDRADPSCIDVVTVGNGRGQAMDNARDDLRRNARARMTGATWPVSGVAGD